MPKKPVKPAKPAKPAKKDDKKFPSANSAYNQLKNHRQRTEAIAAQLDDKPKKKR